MIQTSKINKEFKIGQSIKYNDKNWVVADIYQSFIIVTDDNGYSRHIPAEFYGNIKA